MGLGFKLGAFFIKNSGVNSYIYGMASCLSLSITGFPFSIFFRGKGFLKFVFQLSLYSNTLFLDNTICFYSVKSPFALALMFSLGFIAHFQLLLGPSTRLLECCVDTINTCWLWGLGETFAYLDTWYSICEMRRSNCSFQTSFLRRRSLVFSNKFLCKPIYRNPIKSEWLWLKRDWEAYPLPTLLHS